MKPNEAEIRRLEAGVRLGERLLDAQERTKQEQDEKSRHLITTSITVLTLGSAAGSLLSSHISGLRLLPVVFLLAGALACIGLALLAYAHSYTGSRRHPNELFVGWDPQLLDQAIEDDEPVEEILRASIAKTPTWVARNEESLGRTNVLRRNGTRWLFAGAGLLAIGFLYSIMANGGLIPW